MSREIPSHPEPDDGLRPAPPSTLRTVTARSLTIRLLRLRAESGGGGYAVLLADSSGSDARHVLVDAGDGQSAADYLVGAGIDALELMVLTHAHFDHYGGMEVVLIPPLDTFLGVDTDDGSELNEGSLAVQVRQGTFTFLTAGDSELQPNLRFSESFRSLVDVEALKVSHHGSADATQPFWIEATSPRVSVISANGTTHPYGTALGLLRGAAIELFFSPTHELVTIRVRERARTPWPPKTIHAASVRWGAKPSDRSIRPKEPVYRLADVRGGADLIQTGHLRFDLGQQTHLLLIRKESCLKTHEG